MIELINEADPAAIASYGQIISDSSGFPKWIEPSGGLAYRLKVQAHCRVYNSADITISDSTNTYLTFDTENIDTDAMHSTSANTSRITINKAGKYLVGATIRWASNATGYRQAFLQINRTTNIDVRIQTPVTGQVTNMGISTIYQFAAADYIEVGVFQTSGGNLNVGTSANVAPAFWATWIGD